MNSTEHKIYRQRGKMNRQIGFVLGVFVILVMIATMARLSSPPKQDSQVAPAEVSEEAAQ